MKNWISNSIQEMRFWKTRCWWRASSYAYENSKNILLIFWTTIFVISIVAIFSEDDQWVNLKVKSSQGTIALGLILGFFFYSIDWYFANESKKREEERKREKERYQWMLNFLEQNGTYNFSTPDYKNKNNTPLCYELFPAKVEGKTYFLDDTISKRYVLTVKGIAHRDVVKNSELTDYIGGPLVVGNSYYISFYNGDWHIDNGNKSVVIRQHGKMGRCITIPNPNEVVNRSTLNLDSYEQVSSFFVSHDGKIGDVCWERVIIFKDKKNKNLFLQVGEGTIPRMIFRTHMKWDFQHKNEQLGIENVEGIFDGPYALFVFKNCLREFCSKKEIEIPYLDHHWELYGTRWQ